MTSGGFGGLFVLFIVIGIGITIFKVTMARSMARRSGMSEGDATAMTLLDDNGLSATYLASNLRPPAPAPDTQAAPASSAARLAELRSLLDGGLITQAEYDERRKAIIDSV